MKNLKRQHGDSAKDKGRPAKKAMVARPTTKRVASTITVVTNEKRPRPSTITITPLSEGTVRVGNGSRGRAKATSKSVAVNSRSEPSVECGRQTNDMNVVQDSSSEGTDNINVRRSEGTDNNNAHRSEGTDNNNDRRSEGTDFMVTHVSNRIVDSLDRLLANRSGGSIETRSVDLPKFTGKSGEDLEGWIQRLIATHGACEPKELLRLSMHALSGLAETCIQTNRRCESFEQVCSTLRMHFGSTGNWQSELFHCKQQADEGVQQFAIRVRTIVARSQLSYDEQDGHVVHTLRVNTVPSIAQALQQQYNTHLGNVEYNNALACAVRQEMADQTKRTKTQRVQMSHHGFEDEWIPYRTTNEGTRTEPEIATDVFEGSSAELVTWRERMERELKLLKEKNKEELMYVDYGRRSSSSGTDACLICYMEGHRFLACPSATEEQKRRTREQLRQKYFDWETFRVKCKEKALRTQNETDDNQRRNSLKERRVIAKDSELSATIRQ
jgi:hypothetical protein